MGKINQSKVKVAVAKIGNVFKWLSNFFHDILKKGRAGTERS